MQIFALKGESLDALVWRELGLGAPVVEQVLEANRGLAPLATALPENMAVRIPQPVQATPDAELVQLWD